MKIERIYIFAIFCLLSAVVGVGAQEKTAMSADQTLRSNARVNPSTLGMELSIPLAGYRGRGSNGVAVGLNYSSKVWRMAYEGEYPKLNTNECRSLSTPTYGEETASGWTSDLAVPYIEYTGRDNVYNDMGKPVNLMTVSCVYQGVPEIRVWVKRLTVHLPGGGTHELRADDSQVSYNITWQQSMGEQVQANWNTTFYSVDGSNLRYVEDSTTSTYRLYMPDGSTMDFSSSASSIYSDVTMRSIRKAVKSTDTNGNFVTYHEPDVNHPNGYVTDTLGRTIDVPVGPEAPAAPTAPNQPQEYSVPGLSGNPLTYGLHWRYLEDALVDPNADLCYRAEGYPNPWEPEIPTGACTLFEFSNIYSVVAAPPSLGEFNPVVLSQIDLPSGQSYKFKYDIYGRIEKIEYPTGGVETFDYSVVPLLSRFNSPGVNPDAQANFGVTHREVLESTGATPIEWTYAADRDDDRYRVTTTAPDETKTEVYVKRGKNGVPGVMYGYESVLVGYPYEQNTYDSNDNLLAKTLTTYEVSNPGGKERHPRTVKVESIIYDPAASTALSASTTTAYASLTNYSDPLLPVSSSQYAFTTSLGSLGTLLRTTETDYLSDGNYTARNLRSLPVEVRVKDAAGNVRSKTQFAYDEGTYQLSSSGNMPLQAANSWADPNTVYRANITTTKSFYDISSSLYVETHTFYDQFGNVRKVRDGRGNDTETLYDEDYAFAYPTSVTTAAPDPNNTGHGSVTGFTTTSTYDYDTGLPSTVTDPNGLQTRMEYNDPLLRPTKVTTGYGTALAAETITEYGAGTSEATRWVKVKTQIDATNWKEAVSWFDGLGRNVRSQSVDAESGDVFALTCYDNMGRVSKASNPFRGYSTQDCTTANGTNDIYWTSSTYDDLGRVTAVTTPDNAVVSTAYSLATSGSQIGTVVTVEDQAGKLRRSITNALGQLTRVDEPNDAGQLGSVSSPNQATYYTYDVLNNLKTVNQGVQTRTFSYDSLSRLTQAVNPESGTINYSYDSNGNLTNKTDARTITTAYSYDALNRVTQRSYSGESGYTTPAVSYFYDNLTNAKGKLIKVENAYSTTEYQAFDILGRVTQSQQTTDGTAYDPMTYTYNLSGALIEQTYPSGRVVQNTLDVNGDLAKVESKKDANDIFRPYAGSFIYTAAGAVASMRLGNGKFENSTFNSRLQPVQIGLGSSASTQDLLKLNYGYGTTDNNGNVQEQVITVAAVASVPGFVATQTYSYDSLNRISQATETIPGQTGWQQTFTYDRYGNRRFDTEDTTTLAPKCAEAVCNPQIDPATNKLVGYVFDGSGNTTTDATGQTFIYDAENKQVQVNDANGIVGQYFYNGDGLRIKKVVPDTGETTIFVYDASNRLVAEYSTVVEPPQTAKISYLTNDHLGSPRITTDALGQVISRRDFMPFGEEIYRSGYGSDSVHQKFTGYERDNETNLDYAKARMFGSSLGRFTSADNFLHSTRPQNPASWNLYVYTLNNPLRYVDPNGELETDANGKVVFHPTGTESKESLEKVMKDGKEVKINGKTVYVKVSYTIRTGYVMANDKTTIIQAGQIDENGTKVEITDKKGNLLSFDSEDVAANGQLREIQDAYSNAGYDAASNCHGTTFAGGQLIIGNDQVEKIIKGDGYRKIDLNNEKVQAGDVFIYSGDGSVKPDQVEHSVKLNRDLRTVTSKGGYLKLVPNAVLAPGGSNSAWNYNPQALISGWTLRAKPRN